MTAAPAIRSRIASLRNARRARRARVLGGLGLVLGLGVALTLSFGQSVYGPGTVWAVLGGADLPGAGFTIRELRLPRALVALAAGAAFGLGGAAFQTLLRNPLASPDILGISAGASAAAVFAIVILGLGGTAVSVAAVVAGLGVAALIAVLAGRGGAAGARLILIGIGLAALLHSITAYILTRAPSWSLHESMRWLSGSVNGAQLDQLWPLGGALLLFGGVVLALTRDLETLRMGEEAAGSLGVRLGAVRLAILLAAVGLVAIATAITGPVAFAAFLPGPIAARLTGRDGPILVPAALIGAALLLICDFAGQVLLPASYPVGVVTGVLGAPYLVFLILRDTRTGGSL